jgi:hypothetical protein
MVLPQLEAVTDGTLAPIFPGMIPLSHKFRKWGGETKGSFHAPRRVRVSTRGTNRKSPCPLLLSLTANTQRSTSFITCQPASDMGKEEKSSVLSKFLAINSKPTTQTFPELPAVILWFRFTLAVLYGTYLGVTSARRNSGANLLFGFNFIVFVPSVYCSTFLAADQASYENKLLFSGVLSSTALMLLIWTYLYTSDHDSDAQALASILAGITRGSDGLLEGEIGIAVGGDSPPLVGESEF